jgi:hypothetical protein
MLPRIKIVQVGDVHLARTARLGRPVDDKDRRFPTDLRNRMATTPVKAVFRSLHRLLKQEPIACLLFMGDYSEVGVLKDFGSCMRYLAESLEIGSGRRFEKLPVGLVPGNHDINRELAAKPGLKRKFQPLQKALAAVKLPSFPIDSPIWLKVQNGVCRIDVALLNSCWGCGAREFIPEEFRAEIAKAIDDTIKRGVDERATHAYYNRQFDTPAFSDRTVQELINDAASVPGNSLILACAHHNILPQRQTRLAPYTELVNSGALRNALLKLDRPVLYLHGHIHQDPVEIIHIPDGNPLVCISAPEISSGFNVLELVFTPAGLPLTCYLEPWRFDESVFRAHERQIIPIRVGRHRHAEPVMTAIYQRIVVDHDCYWPKLVACATDAGATVPQDAAEEALETLAADQLISIKNYEIGRDHWVVSSKL